MKFQYNQSDLSSNIFTEFHKNPTHSYQDIGFNSRTDGQNRVERESRRKGQIIGTEVIVKTVTKKPI